MYNAKSIQLRTLGSLSHRHFLKDCNGMELGRGKVIWPRLCSTESAGMHAVHSPCKRTTSSSKASTLQKLSKEAEYKKVSSSAF